PISGCYRSQAMGATSFSKSCGQSALHWARSLLSYSYRRSSQVKMVGQGRRARESVVGMSEGVRHDQPEDEHWLHPSRWVSRAGLMSYRPVAEPWLQPMHAIAGRACDRLDGISRWWLDEGASPLREVQVALGLLENKEIEALHAADRREALLAKPEEVSESA